jgi:hypothetical protein
MVGVLVNDDLIATPVPVRDNVVIKCGDVPKEVPKPEAFPVSSHKQEWRSKAACEAPVRPRVIEVVVRIVDACIVSDPSIVPGVDVRDVWVAFLVAVNTILGCSRVLLASGSSGRPRGSRAVSGNVSAANRCGVTTTAAV